MTTYLCSICKAEHPGAYSYHYCPKCLKIKRIVEPLLNEVLVKVIKQLREVPE